jgi:hypothetical protein
MAKKERASAIFDPNSIMSLVTEVTTPAKLTPPVYELVKETPIKKLKQGKGARASEIRVIKANQGRPKKLPIGEEQRTKPYTVYLKPSLFERFVKEATEKKMTGADLIEEILTLRYK